MHRWALLLCFAATPFLSGQDAREVSASAARAYQEVARFPAPTAEQTAQCQQEQAIWIARGRTKELPRAHFQRGFCLLIGARLSHDTDSYRAALSEFAAASSGPELQLAAVITRLQGGIEPSQAVRELPAALDRAASCPESALAPEACPLLTEAGRMWLGVHSLEEGNIEKAARLLTVGGWSHWTAGKRAFAARRYAEAAGLYRLAVEAWKNSGPMSAGTLLEPAPVLAAALAETGEAEWLAGDARRATTTFSAALRLDDGLARVWFLRGLAREASGAREDALRDFSIASRTALARSHDGQTGEGHYYRGVLLYRRGDFTGAEDEFSIALLSGVPAPARSDASAWRHMAAVAGGACESSLHALDRALDSVSPLFPRGEAGSARNSCATRAALNPR
jgi:tetratricopeptide (TPR) repeat protein